MDPLSGALFAGFGLILAAATVLPTILMIVALVYVALRVRDAKADTPDPDLGLKTAYWLLYSLGILTFHLGLTVLVVHLLQGDNGNGPPPRPGLPANVGRVPAPLATEWSPVSRVGCGLVAAGLVVAGAFYLLGALGTRDRQWPTVRRVFTGGRIAVIGVVALVAFTGLVVLVFQKDTPSGGVYETCVGTLGVWLPSLAVHVFLFRWGGTPAYHVPPPERSRSRRNTPVRYNDHDEEVVEAGEVVIEEDAPPEEEQPRRRRPRDDD